MYASDSAMNAVHQGGTWQELTAWWPGQPGLRHVVCDVYGTLLKVSPGPASAAILWQQTWARLLPRQPLIAWEEMTHRLQAMVAGEHARAGRYHEVDWVKIFQALGGNARLARHHAWLQRRCELMSGAAEFLQRLRLPISLCSNAQAYTRMELRLALRAAKLRDRRFDRNLNFWSYEQGMAKPSPVIFSRILSMLQLPASQVIMIGDRRDNDIQPAKAQGWSTWHLRD